MFHQKHNLKTLPLYSNLVIAYMKHKLYADAISNADYALFILNLCTPEQRPAALQEKIEFNLTSALCAHAQELLISRKPEDASALHSKAIYLIDGHQNILSKTSMSSIQAVITQLQNYLVPAQDFCHPGGKPELVGKECKLVRPLAACSLVNFSAFSQNIVGSVEDNVLYTNDGSL